MFLLIPFPPMKDAGEEMLASFQKVSKLIDCFLDFI